MAGLFSLSINPKLYKGDFLKDIFWGSFYGQHLGEEYAGLAIFNGKDIKIRTHRGHFRDTFVNDMNGFDGTEAIGYCGYAREPFSESSKLGEFSICFSGNIINLPDLLERFKGFSHTFTRDGGDDIEMIGKLISQGNDVIDGIKKMAKEIQGAYSLLILTKEGVYATCSPTGHWPLIIGEKEGAVAVASESGGIRNLGFNILGDVEPEEIVLLKQGIIKKRITVPSNLIQYCSFVWVYTSFPNQQFRGIPASLVRKKIAGNLASRDIKNGFIPDIVAPVPDSGRFHAIGYKQEFDRQINEGRIQRVPYYDEVLLKYAYAGRSFTPPTKEARDQEAFIKILPSGENYEGKIVVIVDDSIVRGTQTQTNLIPKLRMLGIKEIHLRIANPELRSHCPFGKTIKRGETLADRKPSNKEKIEFLGVDSLEYSTIDELVSAIGINREHLCVSCSLPEKN